MSPIEHFILTYHNKPSILEALRNLANPYDSTGAPRGLNKTTLAELAGVTYPVVNRTQLALYDRIPPKLLIFFQKHGHPYEDYPKMYRNHRGLVEAKSILKQKDLAGKDGKHWIVEEPEDVVTVPLITFADWRRRHFDSVMNMAKVLLVNPTIIANYENGITKSLPVGIRRQFRKFGMSDLVVNQISALDCPVRTDLIEHD